MLALPRFGCINLHASLLPKYRGAAPIQWAVAMGETVTGNTTMLLEEGLDTGPILLQQAVAIGPEQTAVDLFDVLAEVARHWWLRPSPASAPDHRAKGAGSLARYACATLEREDGRMDFSARTQPISGIAGEGFSPGPARSPRLKGKKLIVHRTAWRIPRRPMLTPLPNRTAGHRRSSDAGCVRGNTWLELIELQLEGKKRLAAAEFLRGMPAGVRLG